MLTKKHKKITVFRNNNPNHKGSGYNNKTNPNTLLIQDLLAIADFFLDNAKRTIINNSFFFCAHVHTKKKTEGIAE